MTKAAKANAIILVFIGFIAGYMVSEVIHYVRADSSEAAPASS